MQGQILSKFMICKNIWLERIERKNEPEYKLLKFLSSSIYWISLNEICKALSLDFNVVYIVCKGWLSLGMIDAKDGNKVKINVAGVNYYLNYKMLYDL